MCLKRPPTVVLTRYQKLNHRATPTISSKNQQTARAGPTFVDQSCSEQGEDGCKSYQCDIGWHHSIRLYQPLPINNVSGIVSGVTRALADCTHSITPMKIAMSTYLLFTTSSSSVLRRHARHRLDLFILVLEEMRSGSWSAGLTLDFFRKALDRVPRQRTTLAWETPESKARDPSSIFKGRTPPPLTTCAGETPFLQPNLDSSWQGSEDWSAFWSDEG